ncbi:MAG: hypothetical protein RL368_1069 [Pseudomonadota bacterium]|jgi:hypothetical protein
MGFEQFIRLVGAGLQHYLTVYPASHIKWCGWRVKAVFLKLTCYWLIYAKSYTLKPRSELIGAGFFFVENKLIYFLSKS